MRKLTLLILFLMAAGYLTAQWNADPSLNNSLCVAKKSQAYPKTVSDGNGGVFTCWQDNRKGSFYGDIYIQHTDKNGKNKWATNGMLISNASQKAEHPKITSDGNGGCIVAWMDHRYAGTDNNEEADVFAQKIDAAGNILWQQGGIAVDSTANSSENISICTDGNGGAFIAWDEYWQSSYEAIFAQHINSSGVIQWSTLPYPLKISYPSYGVYAYEPQLIPDGDNGFIITWYDDRNYYQDDIFAQRLNVSGAELWSYDDVNICAANYDKLHPQIIANDKKGAIITWADSRSKDSASNGRGFGFDIYVQSIDSNANKLWQSPNDPWYANNGILIAHAAGNQLCPQLAEDGTGGAYIAWTDERNATDELYLQHVSEAGDTLFKANGLLIANKINYPGSALFEDELNPVSVLYDGNNNVITAWTDTRIADNSNIYAQKISSAGNILWADGGVPVCNAGDNQINAQIAAGNNGSGIIVWQDDRNYNTSSDDIYVSLVNNDGVLPVNLLSFTAEYLHSIVQLNWQTTSEINNQYFSIERSADALRFDSIGMIKNIFNVHGNAQYSFEDNNPLNGINYYRLKQADDDGHITYSKIIPVQVNKIATQLFTVYPNPAKEFITAHLKIPLNAIDILVYDNGGQKLIEQNMPSGSVQVTVNITRLPAGSYNMIVVDKSGKRYTTAFIKD
jgi:hypothetical protein